MKNGAKEQEKIEEPLSFSSLRDTDRIELATFLAGIISFFVYFIPNAFNSRGEFIVQFENFVDFISNGLILTIASMYFTERVVQFIRNRRRDEAIQRLIKNSEIEITQKIEAVSPLFDGVHDRIEHMRQEIERSERVSYLGGKDDGLDVLRSRLKRAHKVYNTFVSYGVKNSQKDALLYSSFSTDDIASHFFEMLCKRNTVVVNIVSNDTLYFANDINEMVTGEYKDRVLGSHIVGVLKSNFPIVNFTVVEYSDRKEDREVIFGWGHHKDDWSGCTFSSTDQHMISTFMSYFKCLSSNDLCEWHDDANERLENDTSEPLAAQARS